MFRLSVIVFIIICIASVMIPPLRAVAIWIIVGTAIALAVANVVFNILVKKTREDRAAIEDEAQRRNESLAEDRARLEELASDFKENRATDNKES